ncbi:hypothetical protein ES703_68655 [subsurface metagenome]
MSPPPYIVKLLHNFTDYLFVIGDNAGLEISFVLALGPHPGTGEIGTAGISEAAVNYHGFKVNSRT